MAGRSAQRRAPHPMVSPAVTLLLWALAVALILIGIAGTVLPALPGALFVFGGILLAAWIGDFRQITGWTVGLCAVLTALSFVVDVAATGLSAARARASRLGLIGAAVGTFAGVFTGLIGLLFMPLAGAAIGEFIARRELLAAGRVGLATWVGLLIATVLKIAIVFAMVGLLVGALLIG